MFNGLDAIYLIFCQSHDVSELAPGRSISIQIYRTLGYIKYGRIDRRFHKCTAGRLWNIFCKAIDIGQATAICEGKPINAFHTATDGDGGQTVATREGIFADAGYTVGDDDRGQASATIESSIVDAGHTISDCDGGQTAAINEDTIADAGHTTGDDCALTTGNLGICCCLYNGITIVT